MRALTGTDPDRLKEEKERGITIDLGFAHCELGDGVVASFVDVPGHERFVRHMLAGAHGIDAVALVVAADESVMPQTREHFHICRLLGVPRGLVVLTKCDAADEDSQAIAELEVRELVAGSFLERAPLVRVSARTGEGLPALREALLALARASPLRPSDGLLRLPVDRVFSMKGFGTVVTGTLVAGELATGEEIEALPSGRRARVRGLQVHGESVERAGGRDAHGGEPGRGGRGPRPRRGAGPPADAARDLDDRRGGFAPARRPAARGRRAGARPRRERRSAGPRATPRARLPRARDERPRTASAREPRRGRTRGSPRAALLLATGHDRRRPRRGSPSAAAPCRRPPGGREASRRLGPARGGGGDGRRSGLLRDRGTASRRPPHRAARAPGGGGPEERLPGGPRARPRGDRVAGRPRPPGGGGARGPRGLPQGQPAQGGHAARGAAGPRLRRSSGDRIRAGAGRPRRGRPDPSASRRRGRCAARGAPLRRRGGGARAAPRDRTGGRPLGRGAPGPGGALEEGRPAPRAGGPRAGHRARPGTRGRGPPRSTGTTSRRSSSG